MKFHERGIAGAGSTASKTSTRGLAVCCQDHEVLARKAKPLGENHSAEPQMPKPEAADLSPSPKLSKLKWALVQDVGLRV